MASRNDNAPHGTVRDAPTRRSPWLPVNVDPGSDDTGTRDGTARSTPVLPTPRPSYIPTLYPQPIEDDDDAEIIPAVTPPPPEEILPTDTRAVWESVTRPAPSTAVPTAPAQEDPLRSLSEAAVRHASMSAAGAPAHINAPTPVPTFPLPGTTLTHLNPPSYPTPASAVAPGFMAAPPRDEPQPFAGSEVPALVDHHPPYTPAFGIPTVPHTAAPDTNDDDEGDGHVPDPRPARTPWWRSWPFLVVVGLIVMGGVGFAVVTMLSDSDPVELTPPVIIATPETAELDPISIDEPTDFQSAFPATVGTYALTGIEVPPLGTLDLEVRAAEASVLTYATAHTAVTIRAIQHFDVEAAVAQFEILAATGTDRDTVTAGGDVVGERVTVTSHEGKTLVWRNNTATFELTGPASEVEEFFAQFTL